MFNLSGMLENSVTKVGGAETWKFGPINLFGDFRTRSLASTPNCIRRRRCLAQGGMHGRSAFSASLKMKWSLLVAAGGMQTIMGGMGRSVGE